MKKLYLKLLLIALIFTFISCETYKKYEPEFSPAYPISGDWYVRDYEPGNLDYGNARSKDYNLYLYGSSFKPESEIWINNNEGTRASSYEGKYIIKGTYNKEGLSFNTDNSPFYSADGGLHLPDSIIRYVTISESKIFKNDWPKTDSIFFRVIIYSGEGVQLPIDTFYTAGHRFKGTEDPYFDE